MARKQLAPLDMNTNKVTNLGTPTSGTDAATKAYVDSIGSGSSVPYVGISAPVSPTDGMLWWDTDDNSGEAAGDVTGPTSSADNSIAIFDGTTGRVLRDSENSYWYFDDTEGPDYALIAGQINSTYILADLIRGRVWNRVTSTTSASSLTPTLATTDIYAYTALASNLTINAPTGSLEDGDKLMFRIKDNGTSRTLTWNAIFRTIGVTLPTATTTSKTMYIGCIYNSTDTKWDVIAVTTEA